MRNLIDRSKRWSIILAGGDGVRLRPVTRFISGDDRPKQFCPLYGGRTLLEQAWQRAQGSVRADRILFSLNQIHQDFYPSVLRERPSQHVVQPRNRGTAAAILTSLLVIARKDPDATVAIFPSDHYYSDENTIVDAVESAFSLSRREPESVVLVGATPQGPEVEYGWIETGASAQGRHDAFRIQRFHEKPSTPIARILFEDGALWNTFVMVGKVLAFLEMICSAMPGMVGAFQKAPALRASNEELLVPDALYARISSVDFSQQVLSRETQRLIVQQLGPVTWSDLGDCDRVVAALSSSGLEPEWARNWNAAKPPRAVPLHASLAVSA